MNIHEFFFNKKAIDDFSCSIIRPQKSKKIIKNEIGEIDDSLTKEIDDSLTKEIDDSLTKEIDDSLTKEIDDSLTKEIDDSLTKEIDNKTEDLEEIREETVRVEMKYFKKFLSKISFKGSCLTKASLIGVDLTNLGYGAIIREIYEFIGDINQIKIHSTIPIIEGKFTQKGYVFVPSINISVQGVTADRSVREIISQILGNDYTFHMEISCFPKKWILYNE